MSGGFGSAAKYSGIYMPCSVKITGTGSLTVIGGDRAEANGIYADSLTIDRCNVTAIGSNGKPALNVNSLVLNDVSVSDSDDGITWEETESSSQKRYFRSAAPTPPAPPAAPNPPATGDAANLILWFALLSLSAMGMVSLKREAVRNGTNISAIVKPPPIGGGFCYAVYFLGTTSSQ